MLSFRKQYIVRPFQRRLIVFQASYFALLGGALYLCFLAPLLREVQDATLATNLRATSAATLLLFDRRVLPVFLPLLVVLFAHSVLVSHRVAGPLYRIGRVLSRMKDGDLSMEVRVREKDYLQEEAALLDATVSGLRARLREARQRASELEGALTGSPSSEELSEALESARALTATLEHFRLEPVAERGEELPVSQELAVGKA